MSRKKRQQSILDAKDAAAKSEQQKRRSRPLIIVSSILIAALMSIGVLAQFGIFGGAVGSSGSTVKSSLISRTLDPSAAPATIQSATAIIQRIHLCRWKNAGG